MKRTLAILLIFSISLMTPYTGMQVQALAATTAAAPQQEYAAGAPQQEYQEYQEDWDVQFSDEQLENLVAPIALYPDPLLAQVLLAATFPDQIDEAARQARAYGTGYNIDSELWDVSVRAVAHYPAVLSMMADKIDWTTSLGQAYVNQSSDLMDAVQRLRRQARSAGYLVTTPEQEIVEEGGYVYVYPAQPQYIYVPVYDPAVIFISRPVYHAGPVLWFGIGLAIGAWLNHDCDWGHHRVFYHGWEGGPRWIGRSRPYVRVNNFYVNNNYRNVVTNRNVVNRRVNYGALNRYNTVHRDVDYGNVRRQRGAAGARPAPTRPAEMQRDNKIIRRNIDPNDPRINDNRGRGRLPQAQPQVRQPETPTVPQQRGNVQVPRVPETTRPQAPLTQQQRGNVRVPRVPETTRPQAPPTQQQRGNVQVPRVPETTRPQAPPTQQQRGNVQVPRVPETTRPQAPPTQQQRGNVQVPRQPQSVFRGNQGAIDSRSASHRGQASRQQQSQPVPAAKPAPRQQAPPAPRSQKDQPRGRGR